MRIHVIAEFALSQKSIWDETSASNDPSMPLMPSDLICMTLLQGFIWVEAHKMDYVRDALRGLRLIFHSKPVHQVPLAQMVETIAVPKPSQALLGAPLMQGSCCFVGCSIANRAFWWCLF